MLKNKTTSLASRDVIMDNYVVRRDGDRQVSGGMRQGV